MRIQLLLLAILSIANACPGQLLSQAGRDPRFYGALIECENDQCDSGGGLGKWTFDGRTGQGIWRDGERAELVLEDFDGVNVTIIRRDPIDSYLGLTAVYTGKLKSGRIDGTVTWSWEGRPDNKPQTRAWYARIHNDPFDAPLPDDKQNCAAVPGHPEAALNSLYAAAYFADLNDLAEAFCWTQTAAVDEYDVKAASLLALMYGGGIGIPQDLAKARTWSDIASRRGYLPVATEQALSGHTDSQTLSACRKEFASATPKPEGFHNGN